MRVSCEGMKSVVLSCLYYSAILIFLLGAPLFYLALRAQLLFVSSNRRELIARRYISLGARSLFSILGVSGLLKVSGKLELQKLATTSRGARIVVANHPSILDAMLLLSVLPNGVCVMKRGLLRLPIISGFAELAGYLPFHHPVEWFESSFAALSSGATIVLFPEGTRSPIDAHGEASLGPLHRGAVRLAIESGAPMSIVGIRMTPVVMGRSTALWHPPRSPVTCGVELLEELSFSGEFFALSGGECEDLRAKTITGTKWLEQRLKSWLSSAPGAPQP